MIVNNWIKGHNTVLRVPTCWTEFIILEDTECIKHNKKYASFSKAPYMLLKDVSTEKILGALKTENEIQLNSPKHLYALLGQPDLALEMTSENLDAIQHALKLNLNMFMKKSYAQEYHSIYHRVYRGTHEYPPCYIIVTSR